jgi:hypothetical protein
MLSVSNCWPVTNACSLATIRSMLLPEGQLGLHLRCSVGLRY